MPVIKRQYQKELDQILENLPENPPPRLLLHACCAPCSSYVLPYLAEYFSITILFYNPNITEQAEYEKRKAELLRLIGELDVKNPISVLEAPWDPDRFFALSRGLEDCPEGGERCFACYRLRLEKTAQLARENGFDWFTTTLSISPLKNAVKINEIGEELAAQYGVRHLPSDFKKKGGYQQSIVLSKQHHLYRQNYCGCIFSQREAAQKQRSTPTDE